MENVRKFFEKEKACRSTINCMAVVKRTAEATGLSEKTVRNIHKESVASDGQLLTPVKRYTVSRIRVNPDSFDREAIRQLVHAFYTRREYPTLDVVLEKAREMCNFPGGRFCLWRLLQQMGFTYKKQDNKKYVDILEQRHAYLQTIHKLQQESTQMRHGLTHITTTNTCGLTVTVRVGGRCQVGGDRDYMLVGWMAGWRGQTWYSDQRQTQETIMMR